jgi:TonB family protein
MLRTWRSIAFASLLAACGVPPGPQLIDTSLPPTSCAGRSTSDTTIYDITLVTEKPVLRRYAQLHYPHEAQGAQAEGRVVLTVVVNADGQVDSNSVTVRQHDLPGFEEAAKRAVRKSLYWPACKANMPVRVRADVPFQWTIEIDR